MGVLQKWGLGAELSFDASDAEKGMGKASRLTDDLKDGFGQLGEAAQGLGGSIGVLALALTPLALGYGLLLGKSSQLASDLEAQKLTMRVLIGDQVKSEQLIESIRKRAASTPFQEGEMIEGSKRLLRLTKDNIDANQDLLDVALTMTALNPTKSVTDSVEAILDAAGGGGFERLKEFGLAFKAEDFKALGRPGGEAWAQGVTEAIGSEMERITRGEDLVGALSQTFGGRLSTLKDNMGQVLTGIGESVNRFVGPLLGLATTLIQRLKGPILKGFERFAARMDDLGQKKILPLFERLEAFLDRLGEDGIARVAGFAFAGLTAISVFVGLVGALGGVGVLVGAIASGLGSLAALFSGPALAAGASIIGGLAVSLAWLGAVGALAFRVLRQDGEGPFQALKRVGMELFGMLRTGFNEARALVSRFADGFKAGFGPIGRNLDQLAAPLGRIWDLLQRVVGFILGDGSNLPAFFENLGYLVGSVLGWAIDRAADGLTGLFNLFELVLQILSPVALALAPIVQAVFALISGTGTLGGLWKATWFGMLTVTAAVVVGVMTAVVGLLEFIVRAFENFISAIPGMSGIVRELDLSGGLANFRGDLSTQLGDAIAGVDLAEEKASREKAKEQQINVTTENKVEAKFDVKTCIDGEEIGRSQGDLAVRNGEKGSGPRLPAEQRGRVLRSGLTVTPLSPAEVL